MCFASQLKLKRFSFLFLLRYKEILHIICPSSIFFKEINFYLEFNILLFHNLIKQYHNIIFYN